MHPRVTVFPMDNATIDQILARFSEFLEELTSIVNGAASSGDFNKAHEDLSRWKSRAISYLKQNVSEVESENLEKKRKGSFIMGAFLQNLSDEVDMYRAFIMSLAEEIKKHPEETIVKKGDKIIEVVDEKIEKPKTKTVFIIHGHDEVNLLRLKELLRERWHLEPLVLKNEPDTGRTLIEKFEQEAQRASFAIALLSPDDKVKDPEETDYFQARPNVIFELGWFYGRLGRGRVCILSKKDTKIHSDLDGIMRKDFTDSVEEKAAELETELRKVGMIS